MAFRFSLDLRRFLHVRDRSLEITSAGWLFIALTLAVGFAAINSGSNLLHAIFGAQMTIIIGSGMLSEATVRRVQARRVAPQGVYARTPATVPVELHNTSSDLDLISLSVEDARRDPRKPVTEGEGACQPVFILRLPAASRKTARAVLTMPVRGRHPLPRAVVSTRFPFGLFVKHRHLLAEETVLVYPHVQPLPPAAQHREAGVEGTDGDVVARAGEFRGLRDYHDGDDPRRIHWGATARLQRPVVRELEAGHSPEVRLAVTPGRRGDPAFERHVEEIASRVVAYLDEPGWSISLAYGSSVVLAPGTGTLHRHQALEFLALCGDAPSPASVMAPPPSPRKAA